MVDSVIPSNATKLYYKSVDGILGSVDFYQPEFYSEKAPVVVLLGPLLHPSICIDQNTTWLKGLLKQGHTVFCITHRGHIIAIKSDIIYEYDNSFESMVEYDVSCAIHGFSLIQIHLTSICFVRSWFHTRYNVDCNLVKS